MKIRIVLYGIKSAQLLLHLKKNNRKQFLKIDPGTQKTWNAKCNKTITALNVVQYDVLHNTSYRTQ
jgi:hypothetical protein